MPGEGCDRKRPEKKRRVDEVVVVGFYRGKRGWSSRHRARARGRSVEVLDDQRNPEAAMSGARPEQMPSAWEGLRRR